MIKANKHLQQVTDFAELETDLPISSEDGIQQLERELLSHDKKKSLVIILYILYISVKFNYYKISGYE